MDAQSVSDDHIYGLIESLPGKGEDAGAIRGYEALYLGASLHARYGIEPVPGGETRPVLMLAGTSIPFSDRMELLKFLFRSGYEVASISNPIGGLFDVTINPKKDRVDSLRHYLQHLIREEKVDGVDLIGQSYSSFEAIRLLLENPAKYRDLVRSVILINPPGFNRNTGVVKHCSRFVWNHVLKGYSTSVKFLLSKQSEPRLKKFHKTEASGITTWLHRTLRNPTRTAREVLDIVSYLLRDGVVLLREEYGYDINVFLQSGDQLVPVAVTLGEIGDVLPRSNIKVVPGGHTDVFFQEWQRKALVDFITEIRRRSSEHDGEASGPGGRAALSGGAPGQAAVGY